MKAKVTFLLNDTINYFSDKSLVFTCDVTFIASVYHLLGLCHLVIGGSPYISHKIMAQKSYFHIVNFLSETTSRWHFIYAIRLHKPRKSQFVQIIMKLHQKAFVKIWFLFTRPLKIFFSKTTEHYS